MSIKARLILSISLLLIIASALIGFVTVTATRARMIDRIDRALLSTPVRPPRLGPYDTRPKVETGDSSNDLIKRATALLLLDSDGTLLAAEPAGYSDNPDPLPDLSDFDPEIIRDRTGAILTTGAIGTADHRYRLLIRPLPDGRFLGIAASLDNVEDTIRNLIVVIVVTSLVILAAAVFVVWETIRRGLRPIDAMIETAGVIGNGDLSRRVDDENTSTEVGKLARALNAMLAQIETSFASKEASEQRLRQFVADASHELRTPLTSIRGYAELYRSGAASSPEALEVAMARIESEGARMGKLVEDLLLLARLDQGRPLRRESVDLVPLVEELVTDFQVAAPERPVTFDHPAQASVVGDADRLRQVVANLLSNAQIHTEAGTPVRVSVETTPSDVILAVADQGPGMRPEDARRVFDRFFRVDTSRSRAKGGTGLGLSIVASIVEAHQGTLSVETSPGRGATFRVVLPRATSSNGLRVPLASAHGTDG